MHPLAAWTRLPAASRLSASIFLLKMSNLQQATCRPARPRARPFTDSVFVYIPSSCPLERGWILVFFGPRAGGVGEGAKVEGKVNCLVGFRSSGGLLKILGSIPTPLLRGYRNQGGG